MIGSVWDWGSLKYAYFVLENSPLDAGGWSPSRGIVRSSEAVASEVVSFEEVVPTLPEKDCYYANSGDFCIGELFVKRDDKPRPKLDIQLLKAQNNPNFRKLVELLEDGVSSSAADRSSSLRENPDPRITQTRQRKSLWTHLVPYLTGAGAGYAMYKLFSAGGEVGQSAKTILTAWASGVAVGVVVGQEYAREPLKEEEV